MAESFQAVATAKFIAGQHYRRGDTVVGSRAWLDNLAAHRLVDPESIRAVGKKPGPSSTKPTGPSETKGDPAKKSYGAPASLQSSSAPGSAGPQSSSAGGLRWLLGMGSSASRPRMIATAFRSRS